jgi:hypothetical protein
MYNSDLSDEEWQLIAHHFEPRDNRGAHMRIVATPDLSPPHRLAPAQTPLLACSYDASVSLDPPVVRLDVLSLFAAGGMRGSKL